MTDRRMPSGQGPARRSGGRLPSSRARNTGPVRAPGLRATGSRASGSRASRPVARRSAPASAGGAKRTAAPRPRALTGRTAVLIAVFVALALAYTYPLRVYLEQESRIAEMERAEAQLRVDIDSKSQELRKYQDPEYLRIKARDEFYFRPGETPVLLYYDPPGADRDTGQPAAAAPDRWYDTLWHSVQAADSEQPN